MIDRRTFLAGMAIGVATMPLAVQGQPSAKVARIGILAFRRPGVPSPLNEALIEGLRAQGYVEGQNLVMDYPDSHGREDRLPELAAQLVRKQVALILVIGAAALPAARNATKSIPLVMVASSSDPVAEGIAVSLAHPGGNVTGLAYAEPDRFKKQLELLKSAAERATRVAVLWDIDLTTFHRDWESPLATAGHALGLTVQEPIRVQTEDELPAAFTTMKRRAVDAFLVASAGFLFPSRRRVSELAREHSLPAIAAFREFPQAGLLMSYGPDLPEINRKAASYVDRILKGAKPGDLPIELPNKFDLVINLTTAKALGLAIPQGLLLRANELIS